MSHTPGPWKADRDGAVWTKKDGLPYVLAHVKHMGDAHLMAAAPDLLDALCTAVDRLSIFLGLDDEYYFAVREAIQAGNAAIDKTMGVPHA